MRRSCKACAAKDETIRLLEAQVQQLWTHVGTPQLFRTGRIIHGDAVDDTPAETSVFDPWVSEEEQDIAHMRKHQLLSTSEAEAALAQIGALNTSIEFS